MSDAAESEEFVDVHVLQLSGPNFALLDELALITEQSIEDYLAVSIRAGAVAMQFYMENEELGIETRLIALPTLPEDGVVDGGQTSYQIDITLLPPDDSPNPFTNNQASDDMNEDPLLWLELEAEIGKDPNKEIDLCDQDFELVESLSESLGISGTDVIDWCIYYRRLLDAKQAEGKHLLLTCGAEDQFVLLFHKWVVFSDDDKGDDSNE